MKPFIITLVGKDKPGLLGTLADIVYQHKGNWLASNFAHMAGQFAGFVEVHIPEDQVKALEEALTQQTDLHITFNSGDETPAAHQQALISVVGNDKPGIVQEVAAAIRKLNLNIEQFESTCVSAPGSGNELFNAELFVNIPEDFDIDKLQEAIEKVANDLMVDVELK